MNKKGKKTPFVCRSLTELRGGVAFFHLPFINHIHHYVETHAYLIALDRELPLSIIFRFYQFIVVKHFSVEFICSCLLIDFNLQHANVCFPSNFHILKLLPLENSDKVFLYSIQIHAKKKTTTVHVSLL